jgi:hypothetical protein
VTNVVEVKIAELDEFVLKGQHVVINNLSLAESEDRRNEIEDTSLILLELTCSVKNKSGRERKVSMMVVGYDKGKLPLWAAHLHPFHLGPNSTDSMSTHGLIVPKGTKDRTASIWIAVYGDM